MQLSGTQAIAAPRQAVWDALNDPDILRRSIPGCQSLTREGDGFAAVVEVKIGPIGARFNGKVTIENPDAPNGYRLVGEGRGGMAGNARGSADVALADQGNGTLLSYTVDAEVGGRLAQLGGAVIDATAKKLAAEFFARFERVVTGKDAGDSTPAGVASASSLAATTNAGSPLPWLAVIALAVLAGFLVGRSDAADWWGGAVALLAVVAAYSGYSAGRGR